MKLSRIYYHLGIVGAVTLPALAVAEVEVPHVFEAGDLVSASEMNENFGAFAASIDALQGELATMQSQLTEARSAAGYLTQPNGERVPFYRKVFEGTKTTLTTTLAHGITGNPASERRFLDCEVVVNYESNGQRQTVALNSAGALTAEYCDMDDTNLVVSWGEDGERDFQVSLLYTGERIE